MGTRGNIIFHESPDTPPIYMYQHWDAYNLPGILANALERGRSRWDDTQYLARIIFCEMIRDDVLSTTGYGLSVIPGDGGVDIRVYAYGGRKVEHDGRAYTFQEFVDEHGTQPDYDKEE